MLLKCQLDGDVVTVQTEGKITQNSLEVGVDPLESALGPGVYSQRVLMNLSESDYVDSSGVSWLLGCHKRFKAAGGQLVLYALPPMVQQTLRVLRMQQVFNIAPDAPSARAIAVGGAR